MPRPKRKNRFARPAVVLKIIRESLGLTQSNLAALATDIAQKVDEEYPEITQQTIGKLENGTISLSTEWMHILVPALNAKVGYNRYKPYHLAATPEELDTLLNENDASQYEKLRANLTAQEQAAFDAVTKGWYDTLVGSREATELDKMRNSLTEKEQKVFDAMAKSSLEAIKNMRK